MRDLIRGLANATGYEAQQAYDEARQNFRKARQVLEALYIVKNRWGQSIDERFKYNEMLRPVQKEYEEAKQTLNRTRQAYYKTKKAFTKQSEEKISEEIQNNFIFLADVLKGDVLESQIEEKPKEKGSLYFL